MASAVGATAVGLELASLEKRRCLKCDEEVVGGGGGAALVDDNVGLVEVGT